MANIFGNFKEGDYDPLPVGVYQMQVESAVFDANGGKDKNAPVVSWDLKVTQADQYENRHIFLNHYLVKADGKPNDFSFRKTRRDLLQGLLGEDMSVEAFPDDASLITRLQKVTGMLCQVQISYDKNRQDPAKPWINVKVIESDPNAKVAEDDIPF